MKTPVRANKAQLKLFEGKTPAEVLDAANEWLARQEQTVHVEIGNMHVCPNSEGRPRGYYLVIPTYYLDTSTEGN